MMMQEFLARQAMLELKRQLKMSADARIRYGWMRCTRHAGSRAHRKWARRRASGRS
jgi:hypothetical protein